MFFWQLFGIVFFFLFNDKEDNEISEAGHRARDTSVITGTCLEEFIKHLSSKVFFTNQVVKPANPPPVLYFNPDF